jgi:acetylglutamate kinase
MQQVLHRKHMVLPNRDDAMQLAGSVVIAVRQVADGRAEILLESGSQGGIGVLGSAGAHHQQETCPLHADRAGAAIAGVSEALLPPEVVFLEEVGGVDDVVVEVDVVEEVLDEGVWAEG